MKLTAQRVLVTLLVMTTFLQFTMATTTQAVLCAGSGGLLLGVGLGLGKYQNIMTCIKRKTRITTFLSHGLVLLVLTLAWAESGILIFKCLIQCHCPGWRHLNVKMFKSELHRSQDIM